MLRNLFSKNLSLKWLKILFILVLVFGFGNIKKADAIIFINPGGNVWTFKACINPNGAIIPGTGVVSATLFNCEYKVNLNPDDGHTDDYEIWKQSASNRALTESEVTDAKNDITTYLANIQTSLLKDYTDVIKDKEASINGAVAAKDQTNEDKAAITYANTVLEQGKDKILAIDLYSNIFLPMATSKDKYYENATINWTGITQDQVEDTVRIWRRVYVYKELKKLLTTGSTTIDITKVNQNLKDAIKKISDTAYSGGSWNLSKAERQLESGEINPPDKYNAYGAANYSGNLFLFGEREKNTVATSTPSTPTTNKIQDGKTSCTTDVFWAMTGDTIMNQSSCSVTAYLTNSILKGIAQLFGIVLGWMGALFGWVFDMSVMHFHEWIDNSGAITIYKTVILAFITSLILPLVFYLVIRMLIDGDSTNMEKILPKVLLTALFVYFSFGITGWLVDQSNIITIYIYRSISTSGGSQNLGDAMTGTLGLSAASTHKLENIKYLGDWSTVPFTFGQIAINAMGLYILFQAMIIFFVRSVVLLLCLIFSPLMVLPDFNLSGGKGELGKIESFLSEWRGKLITYFSNNLLLAPVFMFLMMIAIQIGGASGKLIKSTPALDAVTPGNPSFLSGLITTIIVIAVMQVAITVAQNLSGDLGKAVGAKVSSFVGGVTSGAGGVIKRRMSGAIQNSKMMNKDTGWMKQGGVAHKKMTQLLNGKSFNDKDYHNSLSDMGKEKHLDNLSKYGKGMTATKLKGKPAPIPVNNPTPAPASISENLISAKVTEQINPGSIRSKTSNNSDFRKTLIGNERGAEKFKAASDIEKINIVKAYHAAQAEKEKKEKEEKTKGNPIPTKLTQDDRLDMEKKRDELKKKFGTSERVENGQIVKEDNPLLLDQRKQELKSKQENIAKQQQKQQENDYQDKSVAESQARQNQNNKSPDDDGGGDRPSGGASQTNQNSNYRVEDGGEIISMNKKRMEEIYDKNHPIEPGEKKVA
ncbi:MAG: hypothetical protein WCO35_03615 [Candidatus Nomurabacteria bacterium]